MFIVHWNKVFRFLLKILLYEYNQLLIYMKFQYKSSQLKKINRLLWQLGVFKIKMIGFIFPKVKYFDREKVVIRVPLNRRTKNHMKSMYLGALAVGADLAAGLPIAFMAREEKVKLSLAFKSMSSEYLKRPDSPVFFEVLALDQFEDMINESIQKEERITKTIPVNAYIHYESQDQEKVAEFHMGLSIRVIKA